MTAALILAANPAQAFQPIIQRPEVPAKYQKIIDRMSQGKKIVYDLSLITPKETVSASQVQNASRADDTETYTVTVKLKYDSSPQAGQNPFGTAYAIDRDKEDQYEQWNYGYFDGTGWTFFNIKPGTYNLFAFVTSPEGTKVICHDNVTVRADMELNFDIAECTNHIVFKTVNRDGEPFVSNIYDPATEYKTTLIEGNFVDMTGFINTLFFYKGIYVYGVAGNTLSYTLEDGSVTSTSERENSVWLSPTDNFTIGRINTFADATGIYYISQYAFQNETQTLTNNPSDYVTVEENNFIKSPHVQVVDPNDTWDFEFKDNLCESYYIFGKRLFQPARISLSSANEIGVNNNVMHICSITNNIFKFACTTAVAEDMQGDGTTYFIEGNKIMIGSDKEISRFSTLPGDIMIESFRDYNENLSYDFDNRFAFKTAPEMAYGASMPITNYLPSPWSKGDYEFTFVSAGRLGEWRSVDALHTTVDVKLNGESVMDGFSNLSDLFMSWWDTPLGEGKIEVDITNDNFVTPEGLRGLNTCQTEYDTSREDYEPPVLRALRTLDASETVVQTFETAADAAAGFVEIAATDLHMNPMNGCHDLNLDAPTVKVEYAPYNSDNYREIVMTEKPEWVNIPGFGRHFIGCLPKVEEKAPAGWFDLRITLTDAAGNSQSQLVSPAFQVMEMAGIEKTAEDSTTPGVIDIYNLQGQRITAPTEGQILIERLNDGSARKVRR